MQSRADQLRASTFVMRAEDYQMFLEVDEDGRRPLRRFLRTLPKLPIAGGQIDFKAIDLATLAVLAEDAAMTASVIQQGIGVIGHLLSHSSEAIADSTIGEDHVGALGFFIAEVSDIAVDAILLSSLCRRAMDDSRTGDPPVKP
jgi:hypothetical protein